MSCPEAAFRFHGDVETYLGIDGGGSKTRALLVDAGGKQLGYAESGPSNLNGYDEATVRASLFAVIDQCLQAVDSSPSSTCLGLAGASSPRMKQKLLAMLEPLKLGNLLVTTDAEIALEGAFFGNAGILLIAGTGSVCFGKSASGKIHRTGGWGWLADDAGSAGWIGQRTLAAALQQNDGRRQGHQLRDAVFALLGIESNEAINPTLYQPLLHPSQLARLSQIVFELAQVGDASAGKIRQSALDELEKLVRATAEKLDGPKTPVAVSGGLLSHNPVFQNDLTSQLSGFEIIEPAATPVAGAIALLHKTSPPMKNKG